MTRTEMKLDVQHSLMQGIANVLGYFAENRAPIGWNDWSEEQQNEYRAVMQREADRVAKLFGFESAWSN